MSMKLDLTGLERGDILICRDGTRRKFLNYFAGNCIKSDAELKAAWREKLIRVTRTAPNPTDQLPGASPDPSESHS
ncbi:MAG: hypothetical protein KGN77_05055 [Xanthomonadaceae bacterium]|nr:hypothetical protein [Xanthomonadaceae bacterium]